MKQFIFILSVVVLIGCAKEKNKSVVNKTEKLSVVTVNYPLFYFAERIGGDLFNIEYPVPSGVDPAYWQPDETALELYQNADLILANGVGYAKWMENVSLPSSRIINTSDAFEEAHIQLTSGTTHSHGPEGEHEHAAYAFTTWLDLDLALQQAAAIKSAFVKKRPEQTKQIDSAFDELKSDLMGLKNGMTEVTAAYKEEVMIASHPVYQYFSRANSLDLKSVHFEPNVFPSGKQWKELDALIEVNGCEFMIWEDVPMAEIEEALTERNISIIVLRPCGNSPVNGDFLSVMQENVNNFK